MLLTWCGSLVVNYFDRINVLPACSLGLRAISRQGLYAGRNNRRQTVRLHRQSKFYVIFCRLLRLKCRFSKRFILLKSQSSTPLSFLHLKVCHIIFNLRLYIVFDHIPEILRAAKIMKGMQEAHASDRGAIGLEGEMIDAPMLKQVRFHELPSCFLLISIISRLRRFSLSPRAPAYLSPMFSSYFLSVRISRLVLTSQCTKPAELHRRAFTSQNYSGSG